MPVTLEEKIQGINCAKSFAAAIMDKRNTQNYADQEVVLSAANTIASLSTAEAELIKAEAMMIAAKNGEKLTVTAPN